MLFKCKYEILPLGDNYVVRVSTLFGDRFLDTEDCIRFGPFPKYRIKHCLFLNKEEAQKALDRYKQYKEL